MYIGPRIGYVHVPGRPQGGRHGMVFGQIPAPLSAALTTSPLIPGSGLNCTYSVSQRTHTRVVHFGTNL